MRNDCTPQDRPSEKLSVALTPHLLSGLHDQSGSVIGINLVVAKQHGENHNTPYQLVDNPSSHHSSKETLR